MFASERMLLGGFSEGMTVAVHWQGSQGSPRYTLGMSSTTQALGSLPADFPFLVLEGSSGLRKGRSLRLGERDLACSMPFSLRSSNCSAV